MKKVTIKDVCEETGLSLGTVSKYLNGGSLREVNRKKIDIAIKNLGYHVDEYARGFITNKTKTIGILLPQFDNMFYARIASELEKTLAEYGYAVTVRESCWNADKERGGIFWFVERRIDAIIIIPCCYQEKNYEYLENLKIPIVFLDHYIPGLKAEFVLVNNRAVSKQSVEYLLDSGHRKIAMIAAPKGTYTSDERVKGFQDAYRERGLEVDESLCYRIEENIDVAYHVIKKILREKKCTALFAANLPNTYGAIFALNALKIAVPKEISLIGFDDMMFTRIFRPKLTIVDQPIEEIVACAVKRLMKLLPQESFEYRVNELKCEFKIHDSTAPLVGK